AVTTTLNTNGKVEATSAAGATVNYTTPSANDVADPTATITCLPASGTTFAFGPTTLHCTAADHASVPKPPGPDCTVTGEDTIQPTITAAIVPAAPNGTNGWYKTQPVVTFTCADTGSSGVASCTSPITVTDGSNQTAAGTVTDNGGNTNTAS